MPTRQIALGKNSLARRRASRGRSALLARRPASAAMESLEARRLLTAFTVTNTGDNGGVDPSVGAGTGTLRQAIVDSNADTVATNTINFNIAATGVQTISPTSALPSIAQAVVINGYSQTGASANTLANGDNATLLIELDGTGAGATSGLRVNVAGVTVEGLAINRFTNSGIELNVSASATIKGNFIGTDPAGSLIQSNGLYGIVINGTSNNIIGGTSPADRNLVSGNGSHGILAQGNPVNNTIIQGNYIGTNASGTSSKGNGNSGIFLTPTAGSNNQIGGTAAGAGNLISGNGVSGVVVDGGQTTGTIIQGNRIGTDASGTVQLFNTQGGVVVAGSAHNTLIGGTAAGAGNLISGNHEEGVDIFFNANANTVQGNFIGTDVTGKLALPNVGSGIQIHDGADNNLIGGSAPGAANVISGNTSDGLSLGAASHSDGNRVQGNLIGVGADGTTNLGNGGWGVDIGSKFVNNLIGGSAAGEGNVIAYNTSGGVTVGFTLADDTSTGDAIRGNSIFSNGGLAIDLGRNGVTANHGNSSFAGPNQVQNHPDITSATSGPSGVTISGNFSAIPSTSFSLDFFASPTLGASGTPQGQRYLGSLGVITDSSGNTSFTTTFAVSVPAGHLITATATNNSLSPYGDTSEFSPAVTLTAPPPGGSNFLGTPFLVGQLIQAENFDNGGEGVAYHDNEATNIGGAYRTTAGVDIEKTGDTGGGYDVGWVKSGEWLQYTANVQGAGVYDLALRLAAQSSGGIFHIEIDGTRVTGPLTAPNTGGWQKWTTLTVPSLHILNGLHTIRVAFDADGSSHYVTNVNWLELTPASTTIQAEDFINGGEGVAYHDTEAANLGGQYRNTGVDVEKTTDTGGGFDVGWTKAGEWLKYTVGPVAAGTYTLDFRVASAVGGGTFHLEVDGIDVTGALTVPNTGGWQKWTTISKTGVAIAGGTHTLRLVIDTNALNGFNANFNFIRLTQTA